MGTLRTLAATTGMTPEFDAPPFSTLVARSESDGELAQLVERVVRNDEVRGSTPLLSTSLV